jgi:FkbM family methyltransferase
LPRGTLIGDALRVPLKLVPANAVVRILGGPLRGYRWVAAAGTHGCWLGTYEREWQWAFARAARRVDVVFDVGAHAGLYTLIAATRIRPGGRVVALEPVAANRQRLAEHLRINQVTHVSILPVAVADFSGRGTFAAGQNSFDGHLSERGDPVDVVAIDDLTADRLPDPGLIKIDVEGAEWRVLQGAAATIERSRPIVFLATHTDLLTNACAAWLTARGYSVSVLNGGDLVGEPGADRGGR